MLINLKTLCDNYGFMPKGVIHVGAHQAEELSIYNTLGIENVIWIEANPGIFLSLKKILSPFPKQKAYNHLISNVDGQEYKFYITNNGQSSSLLELEKHKISYPGIYVTDTVVLKSKKIDTLIKEENINIHDFNFLNLDIQGAELLALQGLENNLEYIDYIYTEVNTGEVYKNCAKLQEIDAYLTKFDFERVELALTDSEWGDAFYLKKHLKKNMKLKKILYNRLYKLSQPLRMLRSKLRK